MANGTDPEKELTDRQKQRALNKVGRLAKHQRKADEKSKRMQESVNKALDPNYSLIGSAKDKIKSAASTIKTGLDNVDRHKIKADLQTAFPKLSKDIQSITKRKVADDLRTAFTPNTDVKVQNISEGAHAGQVKKTKTKYKKGSEHTEANIKKQKTTYNPPTATKTTGKKLTHKSNVGESYSKTTHFKHGKAKGQVKRQFKATVTDKNIGESFNPGSVNYPGTTTGVGGAILNFAYGKGDKWKENKIKTDFTRYDRKGNVKYSGEGQGKRIKPTEKIKKTANIARRGVTVPATMATVVVGGVHAMVGAGKGVKKLLK